MYSSEVKFVDTHEWVKKDSADVVLIGITHHAQELLGDLVYIELPKVGSQIKTHAVIGVVESVKAASDLYSPIDGEVVEVNESVISDPTLANTDPHHAGWLLKVKLSDTAQLDTLMSANEYRTLIGA
ncbi:MAG: gcvH [Burkholderiales bacterium]|jgi:glycine cleavage system H protein|nr:gcvH [Burkholderiales bacterium]MCE3268232.1 gcvH [Burkholderiales bacterium]